MGIDYKRAYDMTIRELFQKTEQSILFESLANQLDEEVKKLQNQITEKDLEINKLKKELEDKELLEENTQE